MRSYRHFIFTIWIAGALSPFLEGQSQLLTVERHGDRLRVAAPQFHFLEGKPLDQLHNGASVTYAFALTVTTGQQSAALFDIQKRFHLSYDLWEEKFSVVPAAASGRSGSHLSASEAEAWCLDNLSVPLSVFNPDKTFMIKLECRMEENEVDNHADNQAGLTLAGLIDVFSRKGHESMPRWQMVSGAIRLADVRQKKKDR